MNLSMNSEIIKMKGQYISRITPIPRYQTEAVEYKLRPDCLGEIVSDIVFELYGARELDRKIEPQHRISFMPRVKLMGSGRTLLIETEAGAVAITEGEIRGNCKRIILGELTLTEEGGLVFKMNAINNLNLDPQGIMQIVENPRYRF